MQLIYVNARFLTQRITGVQRFAIELSKRLKEQDIDIQFVAPRNIMHTELAAALDVAVVGSHIGHLWEQVDLPLYLKKVGNPLLINFCNTAPFFYSNSVVTVHDLAYLENPEWFSKSFYYYYKNLVPRVVKNARHIITVSDFSKKEILNKIHIESNKVSVIYNAVDIALPCKQKERQGRFALFVGSMDPRKNMHRLLNAAKYLSDDFTLVVVGGAAKSFARDSGQYTQERIRFEGYVSDVRLIELYTHAEAFVYPSLYEGFGIPPLEAQAFGIPVLVSDIPVFMEVFGDSALYCDPHSIESIGRGLLNVLNLSTDNKKLLVEKGFQNVGRYSWDRSSVELIETLKVNGLI